nr:hypothetical protein [Sulfurospirillum diekertiae]
MPSNQILSSNKPPPSHCNALKRSSNNIAERTTAVSGSSSVAMVSAVGLSRAAPQLKASKASAAVTTPKYKNHTCGGIALGQIKGCVNANKPMTSAATMLK